MKAVEKGAGSKTVMEKEYQRRKRKERERKRDLMERHITTTKKGPTADKEMGLKVRRVGRRKRRRKAALALILILCQGD